MAGIVAALAGQFAFDESVMNCHPNLTAPERNERLSMEAVDAWLRLGGEIVSSLLEGGLDLLL